MDATATVRPEGRNFVVEIAGQLPVFWAGNLLTALAARNIDVVSGRAVGEKRNWTATLVLSARRAAAPPDALDFVALASADAVPAGTTDLKLTAFALTPLADGRLEVRVSAPDQPGFLSRLLRTFALVAVFPREFDIDTPGGRISDRFVVCGAGGNVTPTAHKALEKMLAEYAARWRPRAADMVARTHSIRTAKSCQRAWAEYFNTKNPPQPLPAGRGFRHRDSQTLSARKGFESPPCREGLGWVLHQSEPLMRALLLAALAAAPLAVAQEPKKPVVTGDPARVARIRAAKMPRIDKPVSFDTPEADAILSALEIFPEDNPWNLVVSDWPVHPKSKDIVASIGANKPLRYNPDMSFILVPPDQKKVDVKLVTYPDESDKGPYPVPDGVPIEGWPAHYLRDPKLKNATLDEVQRDTRNENGDRHAIVIDPTNRVLYEFYQLKKTDKGWQASNEATFDLKSNKLRPDGWTSSDAAGLPIFPSIIRYDELKRGSVDHAMRVTVVKTRRAYVYPATHFASPHKDENLPRMGERIRLRKDFDTSKFSPEVKTILEGLKKYGMLVADNGLDWALSCAPDPRIPVLHEELRKVKGGDFEVVVPPPGYVPAK